MKFKAYDVGYEVPIIVENIEGSDIIVYPPELRSEISFKQGYNVPFMFELLAKGSSILDIKKQIPHYFI